MVAVTYDGAMARVYADEGGYSNDAHDPGGATKYGITIIDARKYWKADATPADVRDMPKEVAAGIYRKHYAAPMHYDDLPAGIDYSVLDAAINSGVGRAPKWLAAALKLPAASIEALIAPASTAADKVAVIQRYWNTRLGFLQSLSTWRYFGKGWGRRVATGEAAAVKMWLTFGAKLQPADVKATMNAQAPKATAQANKTAAGAATAGGTGGVAAPTVDWHQLGAIGGEVALYMLIGVTVVAVIYLLRNTIIHHQRAAAYAAA